MDNTFSSQAASWLTAAIKGKTKAEKQQHIQLKGIIHNPKAKHFFMALLDQSFRARSARKTIACISEAVRNFGVPVFLSYFERSALKIGLLVGKVLPWLVTPLMRVFIKSQTRHIVLDSHLLSKQHRYKGSTVRQTINKIGEVVVGKQEAQAFYNEYMRLIKLPHCSYLSIKCSSLTTYLFPLGHAFASKELSDRITALCIAASLHDTQLTLDMEEYDHMLLTLEVYKHVLARPECQNITLGIVLQAYLPETKPLFEELIQWAKIRCKQGGAPIYVRLVKGANLYTEKVSSSIHGWKNPIFDTKAEVDQQFKAILDIALTPESCEVCRLGIGSHNIFDLAWALERAKQRGVTQHVVIEMLEGVANGLAKAIMKDHGAVAMYTPVAGSRQFTTTVAYLIRRLDENTGKDNFLRYSFDLTPCSAEWERLKKKSEDALLSHAQLSCLPKRQQNMAKKPFHPSFETIKEFKNEPFTVRAYIF